MRSRPELKVLINPGTPYPGQVVEVEARFESESETPLDQVSFDLVGLERVTLQRGKTTLVWKRDLVRLRAESPGRTLTPGTHSYRARFQLPADIPPRYWGRFTWIDYTLEVRASIPWWPDRVGRFSIPVTLPPPGAFEPRPAVYVSATGGAKAGELYGELSLAATTLEPGGEVAGSIELTGAEGEQGLVVALVALEHIHASGDFWAGKANEQHEVKRWAHRIANVRPPDGVALPFRFAVPPDLVPTFDAQYASLNWALEVVTDRTLWNKTLLRVPVTIVPRSPLGPQARSAAVPAVGRERRGQAFLRIAQRTGLAYSPEHDELRGAAGAVGLRVSVETTPDGGLATVAHLSWPSLGMGLKVAAGSWTDRLSTREIDIGVEDFDRRFHVQSRFTDQARALFDPALCAALMAFPSVEIDDGGAALSVPVALADEAPLADLSGRALATARALDAAFERVPLPAPIASQREAWGELAARLSARFEPGRGALHEGTFGLERVAIVSGWTEAGEPAGTTVELPLGARIDPSTVSPRAREHAAALEKAAGGHLTITEDALLLKLPAHPADPRSVEPWLEDLSRLAQALRGRGAAGPFRS